MFDRETVFILGAGASWHYGYPTGEQLILDVIEIAKDLKSECRRQLQSRYAIRAPAYAGAGPDRGLCQVFWHDLELQCEDLIRRLETVQPPVIDYFLGWNPSLRDIGKLLIAAVMLKCEAQYGSEKANVNRRPVAERSTESPTPEELKRLNIAAFKDNWYRFVTHNLASKCVESGDLLKNKVHFVTFNYDYSLENHLAKSLEAIDTFEDGDIKQFVSQDRILHVYGSIRDAMAEDDEIRANGFLTESIGFVSLTDEDDLRESKWIDFLEICNTASKKIRTIDPHDKVHEPTLKIASGWIASARTTYILGYGFDPTNSERIGLSGLTREPGARNVFFTNFKDSNSVNKRVGQLFTGNYRSLLDRSVASDPIGNSFEKSIRNVYDALEFDFGLV